jgi:hypothetical protein
VDDDKAKDSSHADLSPSSAVHHKSQQEPMLSGLASVASAVQQYIEQNQRAMEQIAQAASTHALIQKETLASLAYDMSKIVNAQLGLSNIGKLVQSPALELANSANLSIGRLFDSTNKLVGQQVASIAKGWELSLQTSILIPEIGQVADAVLKSHLIKLSEVSALAQASLSRLPWEQIGNSLQVQDALRSVLQNSFLGLASSYSEFFDSIGRQPAAIVSLPPIATELPTVEFFNGVDLLEAVTLQPDEAIEFIEEKHLFKNGIQAETNDRLNALLEELNEELVKALLGARHSLTSDNPDRVRHFAISLRELFGHVLHALAPDNEIRIWSSLPDHYYNSKPTRKARLLYICRTLNHGPFTKFVEKDIEAVLEFLQLFQRGTHEITVPYTNEQLIAMLVRMESTLRYLLEIWRISK